MNELTQKIIELDKNTLNMKKKYEDLLRKKKFEGQDKVHELEQQLLKTFQQEGEKAYQEALKQTDSTLDNIEKIRQEYETLRQKQAPKPDLFSLEEARSKRPRLF